MIVRAGELTDWDMVVGIASIALVFEATRRTMGFALPLICAIFLAYALFGQYFPGALAHRGYGLDQVIGQVAFGTEGIYSTPIYVSSTYIFLFILFGSFLEQAGMIKLFNDVALGLFGRSQGGPAKVCVASSAFMGTISGSGVANVVASAPFTISLMKRFGYKPAFAGGVEACSSMGGQIMPPVMGAVAFIMAETLNVPYIEICKAAAIPATLYFVSCFWMVHLEAGRLKLLGLPPEECPSAWRALVQGWYLILPLVALVWLLLGGFTPLFSGMVGLALTAILVLGMAVALGLRGNALRTVFWVVLGVACAAFIKFGVTVFFAVIALLVAACFAVKGGRATLKLSLDAMADGARNALPVGTACAQVGVIIGVLTLTGAATNFVGFIVSIGEIEHLCVAAADDGGLPGARHGHPDDPELHHHEFDRRSGAAAARRAADRLAHVRLLLRHHGRPHASGGAGRLRRRAVCRSLRHEDWHSGGANRARGLHHSLHRRVLAGTAAAGRHVDRCHLRHREGACSRSACGASPPPATGWRRSTGSSACMSSWRPRCWWSRFR